MLLEKRETMRVLRAACLVLALGVAACDSQGVQDDFVEAAGRPPAGITETTETGEVLQEDPDDWRTAPAYQGQVLVDPAYPNPTAGGFVTIGLTIYGGGLPLGELELRTRDARGYLIRLATVSGGFGQPTLTFPTALLPSRGLHRLYLFDRQRGELISYGDLELR